MTLHHLRSVKFTLDRQLHVAWSVCLASMFVHSMWSLAVVWVTLAVLFVSSCSVGSIYTVRVSWLSLVVYLSKIWLLLSIVAPACAFSVPVADDPVVNYCLPDICDSSVVNSCSPGIFDFAFSAPVADNSVANSCSSSVCDFDASVSSQQVLVSSCLSPGPPYDGPLDPEIMIWPLGLEPDWPISDSWRDFAFDPVVFFSTDLCFCPRVGF